ncbi:malto-oligosyltrehalose trehalohydrolase [Ferruginivarius sediminum]|uniref:Malto-oligosyltrehalose trehalohydrolase n=1 Tax=Ferruginivarius sediminum TaxID=2661937 RepID=A0A369TG63_9PROT|nr:malto-oligosyltrehalose trehalohydrolase [Ferruginivarius sediminum]RDD63802.1 malto-oligosyltrehalose trehalohydrolase [Ferruginivarius sediminum]
MSRAGHEMPFGARVNPDGTVRFQIWAPAASKVELVVDGDSAALPLNQLADGWFAATAQVSPGSRYRFRIDGGQQVPDPASRFQPEGVHGPSEVVDPHAYSWTNPSWPGRPWHEAVLYELHIGAFTSEGNYAAATEKLTYLRDLGVTAVELMPVAQAAGRRTWGYDGVQLFAPNRAYGRPEDLKAFVDRAHGLGLMVFLDVVYNHFGPEGNYLPLYAPQFFTSAHHTPWGEAIAFDGPHARTVRDFFIHNALYWLTEYGIDGLRLDAVHAIQDNVRTEFLRELAGAVHQRFADTRQVHLVLENDANEARLLDAYDAQWNDDLHHALHVTITGETEGYYQDYAGDPVGALGRCLVEGFAYQGEHSAFRDRARGEPSAALPTTAFVGFLQNHDQVGNRPLSERITEQAPREAIPAATAIVLLSPQPPLLFMGEEWAARQPFPFFCDFGPDLADAVLEGRRQEFAAFPGFEAAAARSEIPDPNAPETFERAILDWSALEASRHAEWLAFTRHLLAVRRELLAPRLDRFAGHAGSFRTMGGGLLRVDWDFDEGGRYTLLANLSATATRVEADAAVLPGKVIYAGPDKVHPPFLAPWTVIWSLNVP